MLIFAVAKGWYQIPRKAAWISGGGKSCISFYAVLGLLLSVFRNRSCAPQI